MSSPSKERSSSKSKARREDKKAWKMVLIRLKRNVTLSQEWATKKLGKI